MAVPINPYSYNPYMPYTAGPVQYDYRVPQQPMYQPQVKKPNFVKGVNELDSLSVAEPTTFFDANDPVFYIKEPNGNVRIFDYVERGKKEETSEYVTRSEFDELKKMLEDLTK